MLLAGLERVFDSVDLMILFAALQKCKASGVRAESNSTL
jgi:hypothetical protein